MRKHFGLSTSTATGATSGPVTDSAGLDSTRRILFALLRAQARDSLVARVATAAPLTRAARESLQVALDVPAHLTTAQEDSLRTLAEPMVAEILGPIMSSLSKTSPSPPLLGLAVAFALFCSLPLGLLVLTAAWLVARRRYGGTEGIADYS
jgi:hypothetical protein